MNRKRIAYALFCLVLISWTPAINKTTNQVRTTINPADEWVLSTEKDGIKAYYKISTCGDDQVVYLRFVNANAGAVTVSWKDEIQFAGEPSPRTLKEESTKITIQPGESAGTTCVNPSVPELVVKPTVSPIVNIESYSFQQLTITTK